MRIRYTHSISVAYVPPIKFKLPDRYVIIYDAITKILERFKPSAAVIETQFVSYNPQSALKLGMACGAAIIAIRKQEIDLFEYSPKKVKLAATGSGNASKSQMQFMIQHILKLSSPPTPPDAADALSLAVCHAHTLKQ